MNRSQMKAHRKELLLEAMTHTAMKTRDVADFLGINDGTAWEYVSEMRYKGLLYIAEYAFTQGGPVAKYMTGNKEDADYPEIINTTVLRTRKYRAKKRAQRIAHKKQPARCDIAAAWMRNPIC